MFKFGVYYGFAWLGGFGLMLLCYLICCDISLWAVCLVLIVVCCLIVCL